MQIRSARPVLGLAMRAWRHYCCERKPIPSPTALMGLPPDNQAHGISSTFGLDLPEKSRYVGTVAYTMMRQNQAFLAVYQSGRWSR